jgi:hypothetical protein
MVQNCAPGCVPTTAAVPYPQTLIQNAYAIPNAPPPPVSPMSYTAPAVSATPTPVPTLANASGNSFAPVPDPRFASSNDLTPITPRTVSRFDTYKNRHVVPDSESPSLRTAGRESLFVPAPSAAAVFRTPRGTVVR